MNPQTFIFIGRSGAGKGTQTKLLQQYLNKIDPTRKILYIQTGQELREFIKGESYTQKRSKIVYDAGHLQPQFIAIYAWVSALVKNYTTNEHLIFDGAPRRKDEAVILDSIFDFYKLQRAHIIYIAVKEEVSLERLLSRKRMDDSKENIEKRLGWFEEDVMPAIDFYRDNPLYHFHDINGEQSVEKVHEEILKAIKI